MNSITIDQDGFWVVFPSGWATFCTTLEEAQKVAGESPESSAPEPQVYAGGSRYHRMAKVLNARNGLVKTVCGQRGWVSDTIRTDTKPCARCH